ncbi:MAG: MarR family transcriptional regulator [Pseudomonadota bacterium]
MSVLNSESLERQLELVRELENRLTFRLSYVSKLIDHQAADFLRDTPISLAAYRILMVVKMFGEISLSDVSRFNAIDRAQVTRSAAALEKQGFVEFRTDPRSKRKKLLVLSGSGESLLAQVRPKFDARRRRLEEALGPGTLEDLLKGLEKVARFVGED